MWNDFDPTFQAQVDDFCTRMHEMHARYEEQFFRVAVQNATFIWNSTFTPHRRKYSVWMRWPFGLLNVPIQIGKTLINLIRRFRSIPGYPDLIEMDSYDRYYWTPIHFI